jgi:hypothetical protein
VYRETTHSFFRSFAFSDCIDGLHVVTRTDPGDDGSAPNEHIATHNRRHCHADDSTQPNTNSDCYPNPAP